MSSKNLRLDRGHHLDIPLLRFRDHSTDSGRTVNRQHPLDGCYSDFIYSINCLRSSSEKVPYSCPALEFPGRLVSNSNAPSFVNPTLTGSNSRLPTLNFAMRIAAGLRSS